MKVLKLSLIVTTVFLTFSDAQSQEMQNISIQKYNFGFHALENTSSVIFKIKPSNTPLISKLNVSFTKYLPIVLTFYGLVATQSNPLKNINDELQEEILEHRPTGRVHVDDYLQYYPALTTFAFKLSGKSSKNNLANSIRIFGVSTLMMGGTVFALKKIMREVRPDGSNTSSFPSGHTATAFANAEFMRQEFKNTSPLWSYSGYLAASATGGLRMYNNKHYFSDVLAGAGIGILSTKAAYYINRKIFSRKHPQ